MGEEVTDTPDWLDELDAIMTRGENGKPIDLAKLELLLHTHARELIDAALLERDGAGTVELVWEFETEGN